MRTVAGIVVRVVLFALVWVALAGWDPGYATYGIVSIIAATALSVVLIPPGRADIRAWPRRGWALLRLVGWFLRQAIVGGVDVALRAVRRTPDIDTAVVVVPFTLPPGPGRETAMLLMNLMPGTMVQQAVAVDKDGRLTDADCPGAVATGVELHTLSEDLAPARQWAELERRVAATYGVEVGGNTDFSEPSARAE
ncbi:hypothetical protein HMPREF0290_0771 [Corynebacterium efficiens YS-314]|nr:Na+/H+ antiporter subunit E [Corynebacterium efficiens]EEW50683.1 hypothetical protein HMPREF0290_0771 [Corynebacterium efficiens YS-314]